MTKAASAQELWARSRSPSFLKVYSAEFHRRVLLVAAGRCGRRRACALEMSRNDVTRESYHVSSPDISESRYPNGLVMFAF
jgi:hypothetical protein